MKRKKNMLLLFSKYFLGISLLLLVISFIFFQTYFNRNDLFYYNIEISYSDIPKERYPRTPISFYSGMNKLNGHVYNIDSKKGLILFAHGIDSGEDTYLTSVMYLVDSGWAVLTFDGTGTRTSDGSGIIGLSQTKLDVEAALNYIQKDDQLNDKPVLLYGHSMGGYAVTSVLTKNSNVRGVVSIAPFNSPFEVLFYQSYRTVGILAYGIFPFLAIQHYVRFGKEANISAVSGINKTDIPVLVIYGTEDDIIPQSEIGILAHKNELTNPNVNFIAVEDEYRNQHATPWLSDSAAEYSSKIWEQYEIFKSGDRGLEREFVTFQNKIDVLKMNEVDIELLQIIDDFFLRTVEE